MANNENEFENEPLGDDFDQGVDFGEFDTDQKRGSIGDVWKSSPIVKLGLIGAAVLVVVAAVALFGGKKVEGPSSQVGGGAKELKEAPGTSEVTPVMREALEEHNQQRLESALKEGTSSIPTPIEPPKVLLGVPENETTGEDPLVRWKRMQEERVKLQRQQEQYVAQTQEDPGKMDRIKALQDAMMNQFQQAVEKKEIGQMQHMMVITDANKLQLGGGDALGGGNVQLVSGAASPDGTGASTVQNTPLKIVIPAGEIEYAQLLVEANSDVPGPIVALIVSGPFNGSKVLGSFQKKEEYLTLQFSTLVSKEGHSIPITGTAIDPDTTLGAMATEVDHRYWARVILPAAAKFIEGFGKAVGESGTTTITVDTGGTATATENNNLNTKEELAKAGEEAFSKVSDIFEEEGGKTEILVRVKAGTPFGLMFTAAVTQQQVDAAKYGGAVPQNGVPANQQQQYPGFPGGNLTPLQMLQQGLGNQQIMQQVNPYYPTTAYPNATPYGTVPAYPGNSTPDAQVSYTNGLQ